MILTLGPLGANVLPQCLELPIEWWKIPQIAQFEFNCPGSPATSELGNAVIALGVVCTVPAKAFKFMNLG